ncbi:MAG: terminase family protein [Devosia sp.]|nr:terminase family protein [Devosia sp.]
MTVPITKQQWEEMRREATSALPAVIAEVGLPKALLPYQARAVALLESVSTEVLFIEKSRRIGLTWALAAEAVLRAARQKRARGMDSMYISYNREMTLEFVDACAMWARAYNLAAMESEEFLFDDSDETGDRSIQSFRIRFASGFEIVALSSAPRTLRGKQGLLIIDEAAFIDSLKETLKAGLAFLMWGGQVVVCSTHNGTDNEFNVQIQDILAERSPYAHMRIDLDEALLDGLYQRICLVRGIEWTPELEAEWRQKTIDFYRDAADEELFCIPTQGSGAWLTTPLIESRMTSDGPILRLELPEDYLQLPEQRQKQLMAPFLEELDEALARLDKRKSHAAGFDFGRVRDLSVLPLLSIDKVLNRKLELTIEMRRVPGHEQKLITRRVLERAPRLVGAAFDAVGMGWTVAEDMGRIFGLRETEEETGLCWAIKLSENWYRLHMPPVKAAFEDGILAISKDLEHLTDLRIVKVVRGTPRVPDVRTGDEGKKRHGDFTIGLALAYFASRMQWFEYGYVAVNELERLGRPSLFEEPMRGGIDPDFDEGLF